MRVKKRMMSLLLCCAVLLSLWGFPAHAAGGLEHFQVRQAYTQGQYSDVPAASPFAENVKAGYEFGIMQGYGTSFGVTGNITRLASIITACRIHRIYYNGENDIERTYAGTVRESYLQYARGHGIYCDFADLSADATRGEFAAILSSALPDEALSPINTVEDGAIPDVKTGTPYASAVYRLYRAGILNGSDSKGTFYPASQITRGAACAIATRMCSEALRKSVTLPAAPSADSSFSIHFIDVGQADAALVECDGRYMLIDGGNKSDSSRIYSILKQEQVRKLDLIVATHPHEDHIGGIPGALSYAEAETVLCPVTGYESEAFRDLKTYADSRGGGISVPSVGDEYPLGSATVTVLGVNAGTEENDGSIILRIVYGDTSFLFTGDAERGGEQALLSTGADLQSTVLKVGHHGSDTSTTYPFLREVMPDYAVIPVGSGNSYGHPAESTLSRLRDADVTVYRTDLQGDIFCTSDGASVTFRTERAASPESLLSPGTSLAPPSSGPAVPPISGGGGTVYILNTNTMKFHAPTCRSVPKITVSNRAEFTGTQDALIAKGYAPCGICKP